MLYDIEMERGWKGVLTNVHPRTNDRSPANLFTHIHACQANAAHGGDEGVGDWVPNGGRDDHADGKMGGARSDLGVAGDADWSLDDYSKTITMEDFLKVIHQHTVSLARRPSLAPPRKLSPYPFAHTHFESPGDAGLSRANSPQYHCY